MQRLLKHITQVCVTYKLKDSGKYRLKAQSQKRKNRLKRVSGPYIVIITTYIKLFWYLHTKLQLDYRGNYVRVLLERHLVLKCYYAYSTAMQGQIQEF